MALLPDLIRIGPAALSAKWVALMICFLLGIALVKRGLRARSFDGEKQRGWLIEASFLGFLLYRLITVGFDWQDIWNNPRTLLFSIGPSYALWIAMTGSVIYFIWRVYKAGLFSWRWWETWILPFSLTVVLYSLLIADVGGVTNMPWGASFDGVFYHPLNLYRAIGWGISAWWLSRFTGRSENKIAAALVLWSSAELLISWFGFQNT
ncbi:hypothetical protein [Tumebacillus lipolyticus]|uniref:Prolipoprotein diacylglyceryl transferase n=1 Tax=Tumebacillus lipolyticus TaxID=1280370 RepID=A0ABW4ZVI9_9BACL